MIRSVLCVAVLMLLGGCASHYMDSAKSNHGGQFVVGAYDHRASIYHCPSSPNTGDCERVDVEYK
ncbi:hypothetical protein NBRC116188_22480 [Oceaniserpentilla sp. 4NH20-0058]|uniref:hypothetical protein n=1 Tax=Oceaniserpentilla sp. 4NH20-0058 TaxID=3127660 RepID=UPI00310A488D